MGEQLQEVGRVTHFFDHISVAIVEVSGAIFVGDKIIIKGPTTDIEQTIESMEIEHTKVKQATKGQNIGMKVKGRVRENDTVYKLD